MFLAPTPQKEVAHICQVRHPCSPFNDPQVRGEKGDELKIAKPHLKKSCIDVHVSGGVLSPFLGARLAWKAGVVDGAKGCQQEL